MQYPALMCHVLLSLCLIVGWAEPGSFQPGQLSALPTRPLCDGTDTGRIDFRVELDKMPLCIREGVVRDWADVLVDELYMLVPQRRPRDYKPRPDRLRVSGHDVDRGDGVVGFARGSISSY